MLGLLGLMAALAAGIIADSLWQTSAVFDDPDPVDSPSTTDSEPASLLLCMTGASIVPDDDHLINAGHDQFEFGGADADEPLARITDDDTRADDIVVEYDATRHPAPHLTLAQIAGSPDAILLLDGMALATVQDGARLDLSQIVLRAA